MVGKNEHKTETIHLSLDLTNLKHMTDAAPKYEFTGINKHFESNTNTEVDCFLQTLNNTRKHIETLVVAC